MEHALPEAAEREAQDMIPQGIANVLSAQQAREQCPGGMECLAAAES